MFSRLKPNLISSNPNLSSIKLQINSTELKINIWKILFIMIHQTLKAIRMLKIRKKVKFRKIKN
jgi:hypothetical protein